jgi:molecular chaperone GrpE (heat shock protein)
VSLVIEALKQQQEHEREAWRKQIDHERARADRAEQGRDELRDRIDTLNAKLSAARDAEGRARAETDVLARRVNELTVANDTRRARGLLARLRAAWRGE